MKHIKRRSFLMMSLGGLLAACGAPVVATPTIPPATSVPPTPVPATSVPTMVAPTEIPAMPLPVPVEPVVTPPAGAATLTQPIYLLETGQVARIETDGQTVTAITSEQPFMEGMLAITDLAVSPADSALAYVLQGETGGSLITTDANGQNRRVLLENVAISAPRWSPDGSAIAVAMMNDVEPDPRWQPGVWVVSAVSGEARQLLANDPIPTEGLADAFGYAPISWSPDSSKLLVARYSLMVEMGEAAILDIVTGEVTLLEPPAGTAEGVRVQSSIGQWSADGSGIYAILRGAAMAPPEPGLYLADAASGALSEIVASRTAADLYRIVQAQFTGADGALYALASETPGLPESAEAALMTPAVLYRADADGALEQIGSASFQLAGFPVAAPGGNGLILPTASANGAAYLYLDASGATLPLPLAERSDIRFP